MSIVGDLIGGVRRSLSGAASNLRARDRPGGIDDRRGKLVPVDESLSDIGTLLEVYAGALEKLMPQVRQAREALSGLAPGAARYSGFEGSVDAFDQGAAVGFGFDRIEQARRRIYDAVREPTDEAPTA